MAVLPNSAPDSLTPKNWNFVRFGQAAPDDVGSAELIVDEGVSSVLVTPVLGWPRCVYDGESQLYRTNKSRRLP